jgi:hypothetical protein
MPQSAFRSDLPKTQVNKTTGVQHFFGVGRFGMGTLKVNGNTADTKATERNCSRDFCGSLILDYGRSLHHSGHLTLCGVRVA